MHKGWLYQLIDSMLFGKKDKKKNPDQQAQEQPDFQISTMPDAFYGGKNPVVYQQQSQSAAPSVSVQKKADTLEKKTQKTQISARVPKESILKNKIFIVSIGILFVSAVAGIIWYYISQANQTIPRAGQTTEQPTGGSLVEIPIGGVEETIGVIQPETPTTSVDIATTTPENVVPTTTPSLADQPIEFPSTFLVDSPDLDNDGLTDREEELFGTDTGNADTDGDGYTDGLEVLNLYNPRGVAPIRLVDSGFVREYVHPLLGYRLYYPSEWEVGTVDPEGRQVLISTATGDFIEFRAIDKNQNESFVTWFGRNASGQQFADLDSFTNRFKEDGYIREDGLVAYFVMDRVVYVVVYHPGVTGTIPYRHVAEVVAQSFRPDQTFTELSQQGDLPTVPEENSASQTTSTPEE
jgi:hypothetical protein